MNIIKEGADAVTLLRSGCVFEANKDEYKCIHTKCKCICPNCSEEVNANEN